MRRTIQLLFLVLTALLCCTACSFLSKHEGYKYNSKHNYYFKLLSFSDTYKTAHPSDIVIASVQFSPLTTDSLVVNTENEVVVFETDSLCLSQLLLDAHSGDSLAFIVPTKEFSLGFVGNEADWLRSFEEIQLLVKVNAVLDSATFYEHKKELALWKQTKLDYEIFMIQQYIKKSKEKFARLKNGIYKQVLKQGKGENPRKNDIVTITYQGSLLNGDIINHFTTMDFTMGTEMQVVEGISIVLQTMKLGERAKVIVPSPYAWGESGTSDGSIAPFTPIVFDLELKNIERE
ncbi:MAG: FKBP-type peptidyl-prolyl cis-trans isomerase [Bacteroidales bacterium]|nr:FKBP-type peptidyl-prolyl cis-trans isomerase [Bacteroidales bacterium]